MGRVTVEEREGWGRGKGREGETGKGKDGEGKWIGREVDR